MSGPQSTRTPFDLATDAADRAKLYALLASAWRDPEEILFHALRGREDHGLLPVAGEGISEKVHASIRGLRAACERIRARSQPEFLAALRAEHTRLFGHAVRGSCPPYELEYGRSEIIQQTAELADLAGFYEAFGLDLRERAFERSDHISVQCEFLSVLCAKQAWGLRQGHVELAETCSEAQRLFLRDHLARWAPALARRVATADSEGFYGRVASLTSIFIEEECREFGISSGPQWLELRPADPERDAAIDCGTGGCAVATAERLVQLGVADLSTTGPAT